MITSDIALVDTNILIYAADPTSEFYKPAKELRDKGVRGEISICICPQILNEFFAILTDPRRVNQPRSQQEAVAEIEKYFYQKNILKIYPGQDVIRITVDLLKRYNIQRQDIFDLHLVATMLNNNVRRIYTYNEDDFSKFEEIEVIPI